MTKLLKFEQFMGAQIDELFGEECADWEKRNEQSENVTIALSLGGSFIVLSTLQLFPQVGHAVFGALGILLLDTFVTSVFLDMETAFTSTTAKILVSLGYAVKNIVKMPFSKLKQLLKRRAENKEIVDSNEEELGE